MKTFSEYVKGLNEMNFKYQETKYIPAFIEKIKKGEPLLLGKTGDKGSVKIMYDGAVEILANDNNEEQLKQTIFTSNDGRQFKFTDFFKGTFSVGGGSGGGSDQTTLTESAQCAYNAVAYKLNGISSPTDFYVNVDKVKSFFDVDEKLDNIKEKMNPKWIESSIDIANLIVKKFPGNYISHRGSKFVSIIDNKFLELNKAEGRPLANLNKWNPADIWLQDTNFDISPIKNCKSLIELNEFIGIGYKEKKLIGISLKKVTSSKNIPYDVYNKPDSKLGIKYTGYTVFAGNKDIFEDAIDVYVNFEYKGEKAKIQFRAFNKTTGWQGEVKGSEANGGKIGGGIVSKFINNKLTVSSQITMFSKNKNQAMMRKFYGYYKEFYNSNLSYEQFVEKANKVTESYLYSKYSGLELLHHINSLNDKQRQEVIGKIIGYALSATELSSVFVKIGK